MSINELEQFKRIAMGITQQFGSNCEVAIHDLGRIDDESTIVFIENGHVTGRKVGDGPSLVVLETLQSASKHREDLCGYLIKTKDGRMLKSSTIFLNDNSGKPVGVLAINYDITPLIMAENSITSLTAVYKSQTQDAEYIPMNVNDLLEELIEESVKFIGKPVIMMSKEEKTRAIRFLDKKGAFLIKKSGDKISKYYGISKYTLYNYLDLET